MKKNPFILCCLGLLLCVTLSAQNTFEKKYSGEFSIENTGLTKDGNNLFFLGDIIGLKSSIALSKVDLNGNLIWSKNYEGNSSIANGQLLIVDNTKYIIGTNNSETDSANIFISKISNEGQPLWTYQIGKGNAISFEKAIALGDSSILIIGCDSINASNKNIYVCMIDTAGTLVWSKSIGDSGNEIAHSITAVHDGNFVIVGSTDSYDISGDIMLVKLNASGQILWSKTYDISINSYKNQIGYDVIENNKKQLFVCGKSKNYEFWPTNSAWGPIIMKLDSLGNVIFSKEYVINSGDCGAYIIKQKSDNEYIFIGQMGVRFALMASIDSSGIARWTYHDNESFLNESSAKGLVILDDGFVISGNSYNNLKDSILLIRTDNSGNSNCYQGIPIGNASDGDCIPVINSRIFSSEDVTSIIDTLVISFDELIIDADIICESFTSINENKIEEGIVYPNPANSFLSLDKVGEFQQYFLYDSIGRLLMEGRNTKVEIEQYESGLYYIKTLSKNGPKIYKIIKK